MRNIFTLLLLLAAFGGSAQTNRSVLLYGYARPSHPGIVPANRKNATLMDYQVYLARPAGAFRLTEVRIGGKRYDFRSERVTAPVLSVNRNLPEAPRTDTLVPPTTRIVERIYLPAGPVRPGAGALQVRYTWKGKTYTRVLKNWKELEPIMNE
ncbi:hypothetical protein [Flaviaesturariibacter aridisoli]|uniref:DUF4488 domain-containing protein n=1 Tax=Flaviaesturariibacter aridisoli TaxID=2545761 RepID=A0A4R4DYL3_9BACT|nr:hypothetical protein [Flaviaesturariibacter aridisoli]TCZ66395.1 hypothetical protein E0486_16785 [Flaviaesturariibacter aridisoli]